MRYEPQVSQSILDLGALEEAQSAVHAVGNARVDKPLFQHPGLGIGAVQDRGVGTRITLVDPVAKPADDKISFVPFVVCRIEPDRLAVGALGPQVLAHAVGVVGDDGIGSVEDGGRGTVILLQFHDGRVRKVALETVYVFDPRATPTVDRLVIVTDDEGDGGIVAREQP